jgi:predicted SAM-dependent methyltransferase
MTKIINVLKKSNTLIGLKRDSKLVVKEFQILKRKRIVKQYFKEYKVKKLHIGSNTTVLDGWLCSDICPQTKESIYLDATIKFPFDECSFHYVYSEHMIEHISRGAGLFMLKECFRVLKPNGKIRIATPDLSKIISLYSNKDTSFGCDYIKWITDNFIPDTSEYNPLIVLNTMFRNWSHCFLYDADFLEKTLIEAGFSNITRLKINESSDLNLKRIERHHLNVNNFEMVEFETLIFEATKL